MLKELQHQNMVYCPKTFAKTQPKLQSPSGNQMDWIISWINLLQNIFVRVNISWMLDYTEKHILNLMKKFKR